jgi:hypothetical protein
MSLILYKIEENSLPILEFNYRVTEIQCIKI